MERQNFDNLLYVGLDDDDDNWDGQCVLGTVGWCCPWGEERPQRLLAGPVHWHCL